MNILNQQDNNPQDSIAADRWLLRVRASAYVDIWDEHRRHIGPYKLREEQRETEEQEKQEEREYPYNQEQELPLLWEVSIPRASYHPGRSFTSVFLGHPGMYTCRFTGRSPSAADIHFTAFNAQTKLRTIFYQGVPISGQGRAQFVYNTFDPPAAPVLILQDGGKIQEIPPTAILTPAESADTTPPTTRIVLERGEVFISAKDNPGGSGVLRTYYTTDGSIFSVYRGPFQLAPEAKLVMAYSIDRNGNREYPGAVLPLLQLSQTHILFTAIASNPKIAPQRVRVMNADPIPLTGPLQWEASTTTSWLAIEPRAGKTPGLITLSVNTGKLEPGMYTGNVAVRSFTPGVEYIERNIDVTLEVRPV